MKVISNSSHYSIPYQPDFLKDNFKLSLTEQSRQLFQLGKPGQGYIGIVEIDTGDIHLLPSFNKNDGLLRLDSNGKPFRLSVETEQSLGGGAGDLHTRAAAKLKLGLKAGHEGLLMGFGLWKAGPSVKFMSELPQNTLQLIPDDYLIIKRNSDKAEIYYVDNERKERILKEEDILKIPGLFEALAKLPADTDASELSNAERQKFEALLQGNFENGFDIIYKKSLIQSKYVFLHLSWRLWCLF